MMAMNDAQLLRYSRQILLPELDIAGQERLLAARVLVVGLGGLGSPVALYLAAAGVGQLTLADPDTVELSNLQRQIIHQHASIGSAKTSSAAATLMALDPALKVRCLPERLAGAALQTAVANADLVVDASDNFATRYALNAACFQQRVPLVMGAALGFEGQVACFDPRQADSPCYRCLYPSADDAAQNCAEAGVVAPLVGVIGSLQAMEAVKLLCGLGSSLIGQVLYYDALLGSCHQLRLKRRADCPEHGAN